jgi:hypothetical protein
MAGATIADAGEEATCPSCGGTVLQKKMVPVSADGVGSGVRYLCVECARALRPASVTAST